eukprot:TRINITY_DN1372_c0_g1_i1.p1 TRINITY_DN1372_c0_g1~~TRINITY_DN1372_c0_g1_i1.p1  ORF type:complete len:1416 (+),score=145.61 TRINITY_DN1372_c0_g1_i1:2023-6270(+)
MTLILREQTNDNNAKLSTAFVPMKTPAYTQDTFLLSTIEFMPLLFILSYIAPVFRVIALVVAEKESKAKEGMKMMGLKDSAYWLSWHIQYLLIHLVIALATAGVANAWVFINSSYGLVFLLLFLYGLSVYAFALFISSFFYQARLASIIGCMAYFASYILGELVRRNEVSEGFKIFLSLLPPIDISLACQNLVKLDAAKLGMTLNTMDYVIDEYRLDSAFAVLAADVFLYLALAFYFENVIPNMGGVRKPFLFFLYKSYWMESPNNSSAERIAPTELEANQEGYGVKTYEPLSESLKAKASANECLKIQALRKTYPNGTKAVQGISLTMLKGQIFALLGHNGAGKTTTISMLTGSEDPSGGLATAYGMPIFENMSTMRKMLGVCPQHDVLFEQLTPREHLEIFATFKGMTDNAKIGNDITNLLDELQLTKAEAQQAAYLSNGEKRKLSIAIAFIGDSKVILLDEPTSGMDMVSRRTVWRTLKKNKGDKILILTTHYMDEADYLGDRIAIMAKGKIVCLGSPFFLKNRIGEGYNIAIAKKEGASSENILELLKKYIPAQTVVSDVSQELVLQLPKNSEENFKGLFKELDTRMNELNVESYGISVTTLEEVFLQVAKEEDELKEEERNSKQDQTQKYQYSSSEPISDTYSIADPAQRESPGFNIFSIHMGATLVKRLLYTKRSLLQLFSELMVPILLVLFGLTLTQINFYYDSSSRAFDISLYPTPQKLFVNSAVQSFSKDITDFTAHFRHGLVPEFYTPADATNTYSSLREMESKIFSSASQPYGSLFISTLDKGQHQYKVAIFSNLKSQDSSVIYHNLVGESIIRFAANKPSLQIWTHTSPLPLTYKTKTLEKRKNGNALGQSVVLAFALVPASLITYLVKERQDQLKHQQVISGISLLAYWLGNSIIDFLKSAIPCGLSIGLIFAFSVELPYAWAMILGYMFSIVPFTYATSFLFGKEAVSQVGTLMIHVFFGQILPPVTLMLRTFDNTRTVGKILPWLLRLVPSYCLCNGIRLVSYRDTLAYFEGKAEPDDELDIANMAGGDLLFLGLDFVIYLVAVIVIETGIANSIIRKCSQSATTVPVSSGSSHPEITAHDDVLRNSNPNDYSLLAVDLAKEYHISSSQKIQAVRGVSLGMKSGECFALLGTTGSGKTTTFRLLTMDEDPTPNHVFVKGKELTSNFTEVRQLIGYCPQTESHFPLLTTLENLKYYAKLKGILRDKQNEVVETMVKMMDLEPYRNIQAGQLSGGNKRKLSVAIALLGNPPIIILDEPSTGVDPQAKRFMWKIISRVSKERKNSSVIFTTHSMEEAEALSTTMAIMLRGCFRCLGSAQKLKDCYGRGYEIEIKVKTPTDKEINAFMQNYWDLSKDSVGREEFYELLDKTGLSELKRHVSSTGYACDFYNDVILAFMRQNQIV